MRAAQLGMNTVVVEMDEVGRRCVNYARIPAKAVVRSADVLSEIRDAEEYGVKVSAPEAHRPGTHRRGRHPAHERAGPVGDRRPDARPGTGPQASDEGVIAVEDAAHGRASRRRRARLVHG
jgi:hypothetical protein